jgi:hypothetical protein
MNDSVIIWDLETLPNLRGYAVANGMSASTDDEVREAIGDKLPKHIYRSIVCIGAIVAHCDNGAWVVDALGAPHAGDDAFDLRDALSSFSVQGKVTLHQISKVRRKPDEARYSAEVSKAIEHATHWQVGNA